ncbi:MAG: family P-loop protein, partial [Daejeonella sp.]|nr:family P-loop protein [Daejeonella sp.]
IWIPQFYHSELENFSAKKLKETNVPEFNNEYLSWLIIRVFNQNPRQIIQFINLLLANYLLLKEFCENGSFSDPNFYRKNIPQLAKFLLIKQRHPSILDEYQISNTYNLYEQSFLDIHSSDDAFHSLLRQTEDIIITSLEPFFKYRISKDEQDIPGISKLITLMLNEDNEYEKIATDIGIVGKSAAFCRVITNCISPITNPIQKFKFINEVLNLAAKLELELTQSLKKAIIGVCTSEEAIRTIYRIDPQNLTLQLFDISTSISPSERKKIIKNYLTPLRADILDIPIDEQTVHKIYTLVIKEETLIDEDSSQIIKSHIASKYNDKFVQDLFLTDDRHQVRFINDDFRRSVIEFFTTGSSDINELYEYLTILSRLTPKEENSLHILIAFSSNWSTFFPVNEIHNLEILSKLMSLLIETLANFNSTIADPEALKTELKVINLCRSLIEENKYIKDVPNCIALIHSVYDFASPNQRTVKFMMQMLESNSIGILESLFNSFPYILKTLDSKQLEDKFSEEYISNKELEKATKEKLDNTLIIKIIKTYLTNNIYNKVDDYLHEYRNHLHTAHIQELQDAFIEELGFNIENNFIANTNKLLSFCKFLADNDKEKLSNMFVWQMLCDMLLHKDLPSQEAAYEVLKENFLLINSESAKNISESVVNEIIDENRIDDYFLHETVLLLIKHIDNDFNLRYKSFIFENILAETKNVNIIVICTKIIESPINYDISELFNSIYEFLNGLEWIKEDKNRFSAYQPILKFLLKVLKSRKLDKSEEIEELKSKIIYLLN